MTEAWCSGHLEYSQILAKCQYTHWVQSKHHRLWFSTKTCSCYSTKTHINSVILILKLNLTSLRNIYIINYILCVVLNEDHFLFWKGIFGLKFPCFSILCMLIARMEMGTSRVSSDSDIIM